MSEFSKFLLRMHLWEHDGWIQFDGKNCENPCAGWDGESRRCECGNRRVAWQCDGRGSDIEDWVARAW